MSAMPSPIQEAPIVHLLSVEEVIEVRNTRTLFDPVALAELAEDIAKRGVLQPIFVRRIETPNGDGYELIFGGRRLRASRLAGASVIPAIIVEMTDAEVLETQIIENAKRKDITEIEEAESYERLQTEHGYSVADISAKIGKSIGYVYARLKLCALIPDARAALAAGRLTPSTALLVARVPAELQKDALTELEADEDLAGEDPIGAREALARVQRRFMLNLVGAPFDINDAELAPAAGACTSCSKRTGNQPELFADVKAQDTCTDPTCFAAKKEAGWIQLKTKAEAEGRSVVEGKEAKKIIQNGRVVPASGFIDLGDKNFAGVDYAKAKTFGEQLGRRAPETVLVRDDRGEVHELVDAKAATKVLEAKGIQVPSSVKPPKPLKAPSANDVAKQEAINATVAIAIGRIVAGVEKREPDRVFWRALVAYELELTLGTQVDAILDRRGLPVERSQLSDYLDKFSVAQLRGFFVELTIDAKFYRPDDTTSLFARLAAAFKVDMEKLLAGELAKVKASKPAADGAKKYVISTDGGKTLTVAKQDAPTSIPAKTWASKKVAKKKKPAKKGSKK